MLPLLVLAAAFFVGGQTDSMCPNTTSVTWLENKNDCSLFYMCFQGRHYQYKCPDDLVWNPDSKTCVKKGSSADTCTSASDSPREPCTGNEARDSHERNCAKYYECDNKRSATVKEPTLLECPYPLLFDEQKRRCEFPEVVKCDRRKEPKDPCEYDVNLCTSVDCAPCYLRFPSCKGLPDGLNSWKGKEWTPQYTVCKQERVVFTGICPRSDDGHQEMFDPDSRTCIKPKILSFTQP